MCKPRTRIGSLGRRIAAACCAGAIAVTAARADAGEIVFPAAAWQFKEPEELGVDGARLDRFASNVRGAGCIVKDGYLVKTWGDQDSKRDWASAAKPVLSTLLLFAVHEGKLQSVDSPVAGAGWDLAAKDRTMTFRHLANMTSGYGRGEPPGAAWAYNDYAINLYAKSLEKVFGETLERAARKRLAALEMEDGSIFSSRRGLGVKTTPRDFARIGWFWLNRGRWAGRQLLPERFFDEYVRVGVPPDLGRTTKAGDDTLKIGSYGGSTDQTSYGPGVYGFNW